VVLYLDNSGLDVSRIRENTLCVVLPEVRGRFAQSILQDLEQWGGGVRVSFSVLEIR
jgi:hypothetical protein